MRKGLAVSAVLFLAGLAAGWSPIAAATGFATPAFEQQWKAGEAITPNFWGPLATATDGQHEPYGDPRATGSNRLVQYFDKGRMEVGSKNDVTSGLLATELVTGQIQMGDTLFEPKTPPALPIAGDATNPGPTYAMLATSAAAALAPTASHIDGFVQVAISPTGEYGTFLQSFSDPAGPQALTAFDSPTHHNLPRAFADYRTQAGLTTIGYAISEPFSTRVTVGGQPKDVIVQVFERRVLTYTATNPVQFRVEMGNIGQHYYQWRYATKASSTPSATTVPTSVLGPTTGASIRPGVAPMNAISCPIIYPVKGATQSSQKIYDIPGSSTYATTKPESCFMSPNDAEAAGYHAIKA